MENSKMDETMRFKAPKDEDISTEEIILHVYSALKEKGYNPINQIVGYLISDDPSYITSYLDARSIIKKVEREDLIEELVKYYLQER